MDTLKDCKALLKIIHEGWSFPSVNIEFYYYDSKGFYWLIIEGKVYYHYNWDGHNFTLLFVPLWDGKLPMEVQYWLDNIETWKTQELEVKHLN